MKAIIRGLRIVAGLALVMGLVLNISLTAHASLPDGIDDPEEGFCTVYSGAWDHNTWTKISLKTAMYMANNNEKYNACRKGITLERDVAILSPLVISVGGYGPEGEEVPFVFDGNGHTLNVKHMTKTKTDGLNGAVGEEGSKTPCAIYVTSTDIVIKNVKIESSGNEEAANYNGVCLMGSTTSLSNVRVIGGKTGIHFGKNSGSNRVLPNNKVWSSTDFGIYDDSGVEGTNRIIMTNRALLEDADGDLEIDKDGIIEWSSMYYTIDQLMGLTGSGTPAGSGPMKRLTLGGVKRILGNAEQVVPVITIIDEKGVGSGKYKIEGIFVEQELSLNEDGTYDPIDCNSLTATNKKPQRLAAFVAGDIVDPMGQTVDGMVLGAMIGRGVKGIDDDTNEFDFYIDVNKGYGGDISNINKFVLIPVDASWEVRGRASSYRSLSDGVGDCTAGSAPDPSGDGESDGGEGGLIGYESVADCNEDHDFMAGYSENDTDSDLDGIPDFIEMSIRKIGDNYVFDPLTDNGLDSDGTYGGANCDCNGKLSCWHKTDTDGDGIPDGVDVNLSTDSDWWTHYTIMEGDEPESERIVDVLNSDTQEPAYYAGDNKPDVRDTDSDDDGLLDGIEDRTRLFNRYAKAYFIKYDATNIQFYKDSSDEKVECDLGDWGKSNTGIYYGIFKGGDDIDVPTEYNMFSNDTHGPGQGFYIMACANETAIQDTNFNGTYDESLGETDARTPDTDEDCVCDNDGPGCKMINGMDSVISGANCMAVDHNGTDVMDNPLWLNDGCPEFPYENPVTNYSDNQCSPGCIENEVLEYVKQYNPEWVDEDASDIALKDDDENNVPDLFEQTITMTDPETLISWTRPNFEIVQQACSDIDKDGIPDCVERWDGNCGNTYTDPYLDPYSKDSDGDGLVDGIAIGNMKSDVCPFTPPSAGQNDEFTPISPNYSCGDARNVYANGQVARIISCFFDRDGDQVMDCEEDRDMSGNVAAPVHGMEGVFLSESDTLDTDSDDDGLDDLIEFEGWPMRTNPNLADTDGDGLTDPEEDRNSNELIEITWMEGLGCNAGVLNDTDPRKADTDGDGLSDSEELSGSIMSPDNFLALIGDPTIWGSGGIPHASSPLAMDSDGDGLTDAQEYNGSFITYYDSNPCMMDSDGDTRNDDLEDPGCRLNPDENCIGVDDPDAAFGYDADSDGLTDALELMLGTNPNNPDTDGDGVWDGIEDANRNGIFEPSLGETNPVAADLDGDGIPDGWDTDNDGLNDGYELRYGTDPTNVDTDGDCIIDGIEDENLDGQYQMGTETDARSSDTDGDGLPDGWVASSGLGEDLNCNGVRDQDVDGMYLETDPRNPDSDLDGIDDFTEMTHGGYFNLANLNRTTTGRETCSLAGTAGAAPSGMMVLIGLALAVAGLARRKDETPA